MRWHDWKVVRQAPGQALELYNLHNDPGETKNIAADHPKIIATMEATIKDARTKSEDWPIDL